MERQDAFADPDRDIRRYYRTRWQAMLEVLLDWPADRAQQWASYEIDTHRSADWLAHEHAAYWLLAVLTRDVPPASRDLGALKSGVILAIHTAEPPGDDPHEVGVWLTAARPWLAAALARYGGALPTFDPARDGW